MSAACLRMPLNDPCFVMTVSRQVLTALAEKRNAQPLPELGKAHGLRLPPEDACLTTPTWRLPPPKAMPPSSSAGGASAAMGGGNSGGSGGGGPSDMEVDAQDGVGAYPWRAQAGQNGSGGRGRPPLDVNPGEAPDD